jgi:hypothetical protein
VVDEVKGRETLTMGFEVRIRREVVSWADLNIGVEKRLKSLGMG